MARASVISEQAKPILRKYRDWLAAQDIPACRQWIKNLSSDDASQEEGAVGEALAWNWLSSLAGEVALGSKSGQAGPDFHCDADGMTFFVEVTNLSRKTIEHKTGLKEFEPGARSFSTPTSALINKISSKTRQVANQGAPTVVLVTMFHAGATRLCDIRYQRDIINELVIGRLGETFAINLHGHHHHSEETVDVDIDESLFVRCGVHDAQENRVFEPIRRTVSAVMVIAFGVHPDYPPPAFGVLHPDSVHPFTKPPFEKHVPWGSIEPWPLQERVRVSWSDQPKNGEAALADQWTTDDPTRLPRNELWTPPTGYY